MTLGLEKPIWRRVCLSHIGWSSGSGCVACGGQHNLLSFTVGHPITGGRDPFLVVCDECFGDMQAQVYRMHAGIVEDHYRRDDDKP